MKGSPKKHDPENTAPLPILTPELEPLKGRSRNRLGFEYADRGPFLLLLLKGRDRRHQGPEWGMAINPCLNVHHGSLTHSHMNVSALLLIFKLAQTPKRLTLTSSKNASPKEAPTATSTSESNSNESILSRTMPRNIHRRLHPGFRFLKPRELLHCQNNGNPGFFNLSCRQQAGNPGCDPSGFDSSTCAWGRSLSLLACHRIEGPVDVTWGGREGVRLLGPHTHTHRKTYTHTHKTKKTHWIYMCMYEVGMIACMYVCIPKSQTISIVCGVLAHVVRRTSVLASSTGHCKLNISLKSPAFQTTT